PRCRSPPEQGYLPRFLRSSRARQARRWVLLGGVGQGKAPSHYRREGSLRLREYTLGRRRNSTGESGHIYSRRPTMIGALLTFFLVGLVALVVLGIVLAVVGTV